eukprot:scaffold5.g680.t1
MAAARPTPPTHARWAALPDLLWERVAADLPLADLLVLRQGWRGAAHLAQERVWREAGDKLQRELASMVGLSRGAAIITAMEGVEAYMEEADEEEEDDFGAVNYIQDFLHVDSAVAPPYPTTYSCPRPCVLGRGVGMGLRGTYSVTPQGTEVELEVVYTITAPQFPDTGPAEVDLEELRFPALGLQYGLAWALDNSRCSVRSMRHGTAGFGSLQPRPLSEVDVHIAAIAAAAPWCPLRRPDGRWNDGLLLPACHAAVTESVLLQTLA